MQLLLMAFKAEAGRGSSGREAERVLARNRALTSGRPVGAYGDGLGGENERDREESGELPTAAQSVPDSSPPSAVWAPVRTGNASCEMRAA